MTPGEEVLVWMVGTVSCDRLRQESWSPRSVSCVWHVKLSDASLGTRHQYSLVVDEDVKKPNKQICMYDLLFGFFNI